METITINDFKANSKEWLIEKLFCMPLDEAVQAICTLHDELHKYPKTCEECCKVLGYETEEDEISCYKGHLIDSFVNLLTCRDAYWKIAGEQMGLDKPWKPDWQNINLIKFIIVCRRNSIIKDFFEAKNVMLAFPTEEMRDTFYENFKELINDCKELL